MSKWAVPIIIGMALIGFVTKPSIEKYKATTDALFAEARQNTWSSGDLQNWITAAALDNLRSGQYHDYILASRYEVKIQATTIIDCYGALGNVSCSLTAQK